MAKNEKKPTLKIGNKAIIWNAPEFIYFKKDTNWYVILIGSGLAIITGLYFLDQNYLGMGMVALAVIVMILLANQKPKNKNYKIDKKGIYIEDNFIPYDELKSFYLAYIENTANLHFEKAKKTTAPVNMLLVNVDENLVSEYLKQFLPENTEAVTPATDLFTKWFKF